jgi:hypothetical protein
MLGHSPKAREIGGDEDGRALVEPADEMERELAAGLSERQVAEFVGSEDNCNRQS